MKFSFPFPSFFFCSLQHKQKDKNKKCIIFFKKSFLAPTTCQKFIFAPLHTICDFQFPPNSTKLGKNKQTNLGQIFGSTLARFLTQKRPNLGQILTLQHIYTYTYRERRRERYIYIERYSYRYRYRYIEREGYIYIYMLWCYYLGQVWPFEVLLSGPSLLFRKHCLSKKHNKSRGFSTFFFEKKIARADLRCYYLGQVGHF